MLWNRKVLVQIIKEGGEFKSSYYYDGGRKGVEILIYWVSYAPNVTVLIQKSDTWYSFKLRHWRPTLKCKRAIWWYSEITLVVTQHRKQTLKEWDTGQVSFDGRKWRLGKEKAIISLADWNQKWNMKESQKPIQNLGPASVERGWCKPVNFLFWELSNQSFIHSPFKNGFCCVGWSPGAHSGGSPLGGSLLMEKGE